MIQIDGRLYTHTEFEDAAARISTQIGFNEKRSGRYAVCFNDTFEWLSFFFAIKKVGASVLPIHPSTPYAAARKLAVTANCDRFFHNSLTGEVLESGEPSTSGQLLQMSSGTTGAAKCIARRWQEIELEVESYVATFREPDTMTPVIACPTTHSYGLICGILVALKRGKVPVIVDTTNPKHILKVLRETERPLLYSSPAVLHTLARLLPEGEQLHAAMTSGTLLPDPWFTLIRVKSRYLFQQYGCSEAGCIAINPDMQAAGDMGFVLPHHSLSTGRDEQNAGEIVIGNSIHTRDLGYRRKDGMLVFMSRMDDMINVSGLNVYPKDVEDAVMALPGVTDAVAFRKADRFSGERVTLLYSTNLPVSSSEVREWCSHRLASHQLPMEMQQVANIPRQANGKISRREVAERYLAGEFTAVCVGVAL